VRQTLFRLGLDKEEFQYFSMESLQGVVGTGNDGVSLSPTPFATSTLKVRIFSSVIITAQVGEAVLDYIAIALQGRGRVIIGDCSGNFGHFDEAMAISQIDQL